MDANRHSAAIVFDSHAVIAVYDDRNLGTGANQGFVNAVIDDLFDEMHQSALPGTANVHPRT